jgi:hypothetical protein
MGKLLGQFSDYFQEIGQLVFGSLGEVVRRKQVERHHGYPEVVAPLQELAHLRSAGAVPVSG